MIERLDHINIRTRQVAAMSDWYVRVLGLRSGKRPEFGFPGAWLYAGDHALVHLVGVGPEVALCAPEDLQLEHGAFAATGLAEFLNLLSEQGERFRVGRVPGFPIIQVNVWDPDGNHLHVDFDSAEAEGLDLPA